MLNKYVLPVLPPSEINYLYCGIYLRPEGLIKTSGSADCVDFVDGTEVYYLYKRVLLRLISFYCRERNIQTFVSGRACDQVQML